MKAISKLKCKCGFDLFIRYAVPGFMKTVITSTVCGTCESKYAAFVSKKDKANVKIDLQLTHPSINLLQILGEFEVSEI